MSTNDDQKWTGYLKELLDDYFTRVQQNIRDDIERAFAGIPPPPSSSSATHSIIQVSCGDENTVHPNETVDKQNDETVYESIGDSEETTENASSSQQCLDVDVPVDTEVDDESFSVKPAVTLLQKGTPTETPADSSTIGLKMSVTNSQNDGADEELVESQGTQSLVSGEKTPALAISQYFYNSFNFEIYGHYFEWQSNVAFRLVDNRIIFWPHSKESKGSSLESGSQQNNKLTIKTETDENTGRVTIHLDMEGNVRLKIVPRPGVYLKDFAISATNLGQLEVEFPTAEAQPDDSINQNN